MLGVTMSAAQQAAFVSIFLGGCITGAGLLSLRAGPAEPVQAKRPLAPAASPAPTPAEEDDSLSVVATRPAALEPEEHESLPPVPTELDGVASAADVLAHLEAAYQARLARAALVEPSAAANGHGQGAPLDDQPQAADRKPADALTQVTTTVTEPSPTPESVIEVQVEVAQAEHHRVDLEHTDVHGDIHHAPVHRGDVYEGEVHQGDVNQIQQVAVLNYQPILVVPPGSQQSGPLPTMSSRSGRPSINPWAPITISPRHDPWVSARWSPRHDPWQSSVFGKRP